MTHEKDLAMPVAAANTMAVYFRHSARLTSSIAGNVELGCAISKIKNWMAVDASHRYSV